MRDTSIDNVAGVMILYMMYRHCLVSPLKASLVGGYITYYPLLFFMAWFFFKGGMFYKDEPVLETARKGLRRLILPYLTFSALALLVSLGTHAILEGAEGIKHVIGEIPVYIKREGALVCNAPLWFLPTLFAVRVLFSAGRWMRIPAPVLAAVGLACGYGLYRADLPIGLYWGNTALGLCFFALGYALKKIQYSQPAFLASLGAYLALIVYCYIDGTVVGEFNINLHRPYFLVVLYYIAGCILIDNLFLRIPQIRCGFLERMGRDSMLFYVTHFILIYNLSYWDSVRWQLDKWVLFGILVAGLAIFLPLVRFIFTREKLRWATGA